MFGNPLNLSLSNPLCALGNIYILVFYVRAVLSWFPIGPDSQLVPVTRFLHAVTEPVLAPFRRFIPAFGVFDVSFLVAIVVLNIVVNSVICPLGARL